MTSLSEDSFQRLLEENAEFKKAYEAHKLYDVAVKKLYKKSHLSTEELEKEMRLKKLKLFEKDKMEAIKELLTDNLRAVPKSEHKTRL